jgi:hypothetical protein
MENPNRCDTGDLNGDTRSLRASSKILRPAIDNTLGELNRWTEGDRILAKLKGKCWSTCAGDLAWSEMVGRVFDRRIGELRVDVMIL